MASIPGGQLESIFLNLLIKKTRRRLSKHLQKFLIPAALQLLKRVLDRSDKGVTEISAKPMMSDGEVSGMLSIGRNITKS